MYGDHIPIADRINHLRRLILIHSVIYYKFNESVWADSDYDRFAKLLIKYQEDYPEESEKVPYYLDVFREFTGTTTGFNLPLEDASANYWARHILDRRDRQE